MYFNNIFLKVLLSAAFVESNSEISKKNGFVLSLFLWPQLQQLFSVLINDVYKISHSLF